MTFIPILILFVYCCRVSFAEEEVVEQQKRNLLRHRHQKNAFDRNALAVEHTVMESRIVGGTETSIGQYPFFVNWGGCGASLIAKDWVLSAAHCDVIPYDWVKVNQSRQTGSYGRGTTYYIDKRVPHPQYDRSSVRNDFLLMKLTTPVMESTIPPIDLNTNGAYPINEQDLTAIGFGKTEAGGSGSNQLQEVTVQYIPTDECNSDNMYGGDNIEDNMMCAGVDGGGKDSCQGDSGGPLFATDSGRWIQVGVVSWGYGCAEPNHPGVYARVSKVIDWMRETVCDDTLYPPEFCDGYSGGSNLSPPTGPSPTRPPTSAPTNAPPANAPTRPPTSAPTAAAVPAPTGFSGTGSVQVTLVMNYDGFPDEVSWKFQQNGQVVASGNGDGASPNETGKTYYYQIDPGTTQFHIEDSHHDGICCDHGLGSYTIEANNLVLNESNGEYGLEETLTFIVPDDDNDGNNSNLSPVPPPTSSSSGCSDSSEEFLVDDDVGNKGCVWLQTNAANFGYLCKFFDVAVACKQTCDVCRYFE